MDTVTKTPVPFIKLSRMEFEALVRKTLNRIFYNKVYHLPTDNKSHDVIAKELDTKFQYMYLHVHADVMQYKRAFSRIFRAFTS